MEWHIDTGDTALDTWISDCFADLPFLPDDGILYVCGEENAARLLATGGIVIRQSDAYLSTAIHKTLSENPAYATFPLPLPLVDFLAFLQKWSHPETMEMAVLPDTAPYRWESRSRTLAIGAEKIVFSPREWQVLEILVSAGGRPVSREALENAVWPEGTKNNTCDVYIAHLRKKLSPYFGPSVLTGIRGGGYVLRLPRRSENTGENMP